MPVSEFTFPAGWTNRTLPGLRKKLLAWFDRHRRDLPWRHDRDPYRIWVSEVMLQQTTVAAVVPYYNRFVSAFPTLTALAAADEQVVLKLWAGLGYYRRARHLHAAAQQLVAQYGANLPNDPAAWAGLPGVGRYILGAVLSQAFDHKLPIVEANSLRVLSRLFGYRGDPREGDGKKWVWNAAEAVLPGKRVGDFNQAVMELGALVCTPVAPRCDACPLVKVCVANGDGLQKVVPPRKAAPAVVAVREAAVVIRDRGKVLLCRRPEGAARWQNMWEFPHAELISGESAETGAVRVVRELTGLRVSIGEEVTTVRHGVTRFAITMACFEAICTGGRFASQFYDEGQWVTSLELTDYPVSTPQRRLIAEWTRAHRQRRLF